MALPIKFEFDVWHLNLKSLLDYPFTKILILVFPKQVVLHITIMIEKGMARVSIMIDILPNEAYILFIVY